MDGSVQNPTIQANQGLNNDQSVQQPVATPVSFSPNKEAGPITVSDKEPSLHPAVEAAGVEIVHELPKLDEVHEKIGVTLPGASIPVKTEPTGAVTLPMSQAEAIVAEKGKDDDSQTWFGVLLDKVYKVRQLLGISGLKKVNI